MYRSQAAAQELPLKHVGLSPSEVNIAKNPIVAVPTGAIEGQPHQVPQQLLGKPLGFRAVALGRVPSPTNLWCVHRNALRLT